MNTDFNKLKQSSMYSVYTCLYLDLLVRIGLSIDDVSLVFSDNIGQLASSPDSGVYTLEQ